ncbi:hypothetical protein [Pectinatus haikarae]|uniref:hypothetical protein n=1 Tax=Pectinatus haikarae TaxID=349096 RepID=UPI0018C6DE28|nr:hypothetical protein [Pectinatus haikarae]
MILPNKIHKTRILCILVGFLSIVSSTSAETIVHLTPTRQIKQTVPIVAKSVENASHSEIIEEAQSSRDENIAKKEVDNTAKAYNMFEVYNPYVDYFSNFIKKDPEFTTSFGEGGDLAGLSSILRCSSKYIMNSIDGQESISFYVTKYRLASLFGSDTSLWFNVTFKLNMPLIISKKRPPSFELNLNGKTSIVNLKKISSYSKDTFSVTTGNIHFLDELYVPNANITLLISTENEKKIRIPISSQVIQQWRQVTTADLRNLKKEYEEK